MYSKLFEQAMNSRGLDRRDIEFIVRKEGILTDEIIFVLTDFINKTRTNVFFTRTIGKITVSLKIFDDIAVVYVFKNEKGEQICSVDVDFFKKTLYVRFPDCMLEVKNDLLDYSPCSDYNSLRMKFLNEMMVRYYTHVIYNMYLEIHRR